MLAPKKVESHAMLPRPAWPAVLEETAIEVFSIMVGKSVTLLAPDAARMPAQVTGIVGIAGALRANLILQCSSATSTKIASEMLGISPDAPDSQKSACDALGEICNIIAGYFKAKIGLGDTCMLSVPTIIVGHDYKFHSKYERLEFPLRFERETLWAILEIAQ